MKVFYYRFQVKKITGRKREIDQIQEKPRKIAKSQFSYKVAIHNFTRPVSIKT